MQTLFPVQNQKLTTLPTIRHGFFTRQGGVSEGVFASLNCGYGSSDAREKVQENRWLIADYIGVPEDHLITLYQVHSKRCVRVEAPWGDGATPEADALVTTEPNLAIAILTADCAPVLFADAKAGVVGAAHAGWKGALGGVLESTLETMEQAGADRTRIRAVVGPTISQEAYEVGSDFRERFLEAAPSNERYFERGGRPEHWQFDLPRYILQRLKNAGVESPGNVAQCTYFNESKFFSFRRTTHREESDYGRNLSFVMLSSEKPNGA